ncbi:lysine-specific demethylase 3B isoform X2 [Corythoichthys intestinalis]|uniref:lysine-specific demethylase 3B isoform X2 n=1 Tax=Corythoichthys intestinalis TaxID=161448 RepID=UPI0025A5950A|nr:lysine-specific demethylase 3B isoform X2 [Corythoichthys intestinalis]
MGESLELIGKRLLLLLGDGETANGSECKQTPRSRDWLRGTVRAVSVIGLAAADASSGEATTTTPAAGLTVFVEFENASQRCSWVQVYDDTVKALLVEDSIVWANRSATTATAGSTTAWPALAFHSIVDRVGLGPVLPVQYFGSNNLEFLPDKKSIHSFEFEKDIRHPLLLEQPSVQTAISSWRSDFELQEILRKGSYTIQGRKVCVYQPELEDCWALGLVSQHDVMSHIMEIMLDKNKEKQLVDPRVIHVMLGDEELGKNGRQKMDSETLKGDNSRRRRTASEEEDMNLKRFKGAAELVANEQRCDDSNKNLTEGADVWGGDAGEKVSSTTKNGSASEGSFLQTQVSSSETNCSIQMDQSNATPMRYYAHVKENGRMLSTQGAADSTTSVSHTPTPPPLKPAPSAFSATSFPSLGQMPSLVPGAPVHKASPSPLPVREEASKSFSKTSALVSPGPVTISWSSADSSPSVALSASGGFTPKPSTWGSQTEGSTKTALGYRLPSAVPSAPVFGEVTSQTNGSMTGSATSKDTSRPFGFGFGRDKSETQSQPDKNLFFQCMTQNSDSNQVQTGAQSQSKDTNYFAAVSETLNKDPTSLFKSVTEVQKKPEQTKMPDIHPTGNGVLSNSSPAFPGMASSSVARKASAIVGPATASGLQNLLKSCNNGTLTGAVVMPSNFNPSESHQNLFLQSSKEPVNPANPFLAYGDKNMPTLFAGLSKVESESDNKPNLFIMSEPPKAILSSPFSALSSSASPSSSTSPAPTLSQRAQNEGASIKEEKLVGETPSFKSGSSVFTTVDPARAGSSVFGTTAPSRMDQLPLSFDHSLTQKFALEERAQSTKRDSDLSSNSDLSDLSENEEGPDKGQPHGESSQSGKDGAMMPKAKIQGAAKSRPRTKPFKVGQSVLKDLSKVRRLKQSGESFLQDGSCINVAPHLHKCRECRLERYRKSRNADDDSEDDDDPNVACRFFHFRRLAFTRKGMLRVEGFLSPQQSDSMAMGLWLPAPTVQEGLDLDTSKYILANVGDQFCQLVMSEKEAMMMVEPHQKVAWKRAVRGVREMCDVCETTLFNIHWVCRKCGFGVCLDCYRLRRNRPRDDLDEGPVDEVFSWLKCAKGQPHDPENLMPTQIIPGTALYNIGDMVHLARGKWGIKANCPCASRHAKSLVRHSAPNGISQAPPNSGGIPGATASAFGATPKSESETSTIKTETTQTAVSSSSGAGEIVSSTSNSTSGTLPVSNFAQFSAKESRASEGNNSSALHWLADLATQKSKDDTKESGSLRAMMNREIRPPFGLDSLTALSRPSASSPKLFNSLLLGSNAAQSKPEGSSLRDLLNSGPGKLPQGHGESGVPFPSVFTSGGNDKLKSSLPNFLDHIIASVVETKKAEGRRTGTSEGSELGVLGARKDGIMGLSVLEPHTSHSWLCDGRLLCLQDPSNSNNWKIFRECWKQGQPVLVSGIHKRLKSELWRPEAFSEEFGDQDVDLVNCRNCAIISDVKVRDFWDGFQIISKRLKDSEGNPMVLKLKDWPPGEDFRDMMPTRFDDLMENLPLPEYTKRDGRLNLAARLPNFFVRPDLGPKMYNAYGLISTEDRKVGTTNLHLDVSDAVNVMVYVGIPLGEGDMEKEVMTTIEEGDVDEMTKRRVYKGNEKPGALWHIYAAKDAEKIRELLRKVGEEQGQENPLDHDPIHDQSWYLDQVLRRRLYEEYGVQGWAIVQFLGDAVFIPAGAPHQVHNLYSCIKAAEDFVSPEHVRHCFRLTQEFRHLSTTHTNHEDKLQVKNIIYHAVKDAVGTLKAHDPKLARP